MSDDDRYSNPIVGTHDVEIVAVGGNVYCIRDDGETVRLDKSRSNFVQLLKGKWPGESSE